MDPTNLPATIAYWNSVSCPDIVSNYLTITDDTLTTQVSFLGYLPARMDDVRSATNVLMTAFDSSYDFSADSADPAFTEKLIDYCRSSKTPGACDTFLTGYCGGFTVSDRARVSADPFLTTVCGCYVPPDASILEYTNGSVTNPVACANTPNPGAACDGLCRPSTTIKKSCLASGELFTCPQNVCVIDQVSVDSSRSRTGDVNLNTICSGCEKGCVCITEVDASDAALNVNINQVCGEASVCFQKINGVTTKVACTDYPPPGVGTVDLAGDTAKIGYLPLGMLILLVVAIAFIVLVVFVADA